MENQTSELKNAGSIRSNSIHPLPTSALTQPNAQASFVRARNPLSPERGVQHMSVEMALLALCGLPLNDLFVAQEMAQSQGVGIAEFAIAEGYIAAETFYAALARSLRRPFLREYVRLGETMSPQAQISAGIVQLDDETLSCRYLIAPAARNLRFLLQNKSGHRQDFAISTPGHLRALILEQSAPALADLASLQLWRQNENLSARSGLNPAQSALLGLALAGFIFGLFQNLPLTFEISGLGFNIIIAGFVLHRLAASWASPAPDKAIPRDLLPEFSLPQYSLIVALYDEVDVVSNLYAALSALKYPRAKLEIIFVLEQDDERTHAALSQLNMGAQYKLLIAPPGYPHTKPRALNVALPFVSGEFVCVYDAEDMPDPDQLQKAVAAFAAAPERLACVQAKLAIDNGADSILTQFFAIEYAGLFDVLNPGVAALGLSFPLGGTSNHFRTEVLRNVGGWDAWNVTEDADLGLRLVRAGYHIQMLDSTTWEEGPTTLGGWLGQRRRWFKGWMQTLIVHTRQISILNQLESPWPILDLLLTISGTLAAALTAPAATLLLIWLMFFSENLTFSALIGRPLFSFSLVVNGLGLVSIYWTGLAGIVRRGTPKQLLVLPLLPLYFFLVSLAAWWSIYDLIFNPFVWNKTAHGQSGKKKLRHRSPLRRSRVYP
eukprot:gene7014-7083_t